MTTRTEIGMIWRDHLRGVAMVMLALVLAMRLVAAPIILSAPAPGLMAICSGGQIIYISMEDGQPVGEGEGPQSTSCPFFGVMSVLPGADMPIVPPMQLVLHDLPFAPELTFTDASRFADYRPRAPPLPL